MVISFSAINIPSVMLSFCAINNQSTCVVMVISFCVIIFHHHSCSHGDVLLCSKYFINTFAVVVKSAICILYIIISLNPQSVFQLDFKIFRTIACFNKISSVHSLIIKLIFIKFFRTI